MESDQESINTKLTLSNIKFLTIHVTDWLFVTLTESLLYVVGNLYNSSAATLQ